MAKNLPHLFRKMTLRAGAAVLIMWALAGCDDKPAERAEGAGATFLSPLVDAWIDVFDDVSRDIIVSFNPTGSGRGLDLFARGSVDFAFSELSPKPGTLDDEEYLQIPVAAGALVVAFNLDNVLSLRLSQEALAGIFLGDVTDWNDRRIAAENPNVDLPDLPITVIHRDDESGSSYEFTSFLAEISDEWRNGPGVGSTVLWPTGIGALGTGALIRQIENNEGAIGYADLGRAEKVEAIGFATLENKSGAYVQQSRDSIAATLAAVDELNVPHLINPEGPELSPLTVVSYLYLWKDYEDPRIQEGLAEFAQYVLTDGAEKTREFGFVALPEKFRLPALAALSDLNP